MPEVKKIISGDKLMVFIPNGSDGYKSVAYATSHQLTISADVASVNSKDHGKYGGNEVNKINWEITSENYCTQSDYDELFDKMIAGEPVALRFALKNEADTVIVADGDAEHYTPNSGVGKSYLGGNALITSLSLTANTGEKATFSCTFTGTGKIARMTNTQ